MHVDGEDISHLHLLLTSDVNNANRSASKPSLARFDVYCCSLLHTTRDGVRPLVFLSHPPALPQISCYGVVRVAVHGKLTEGWTDFALKGGNLH